MINRKSGVTGLMLLASLALSGQGAAQDGLGPLSSLESIKTPMGVLTISDGLLALDGKVIPKSLKTTGVPELAAHYPSPGVSQVLVNYYGGNACPALFEWVTVRANAITKSEQFGTCTDLVNVTQGAGLFVVDMDGHGVTVKYEFDGDKLTETTFKAREGRPEVKVSQSALVYSTGKQTPPAVVKAGEGTAKGKPVAPAAMPPKLGSKVKSESGRTYQVIQQPNRYASIKVETPKAQDLYINFNDRQNLLPFGAPPNDYIFDIEIVVIRSQPQRDYLLLRYNLGEPPCGDYVYAVVMNDHAGQWSLTSKITGFCTKANRFFVERGKGGERGDTYTVDQYTIGFENGETKTGQFSVGSKRGEF